MSLYGKTAFVTGAAGGMGHNIARDLMAGGVHVAMVDLKEEPSDLGPGPGRGYFFQGDITDEAFVAQSMERIFTETGRLDYLVNAAAVLWFGRDRSVVDIELETWDRVLAINLKGAAITARHAVPLMRRNGGGAMVHVSSTQCLRGDDKPQDAYQAAKAGIIALSKSLAIQFATENIRSNVLIPGPTESPMQERWQRDPELKRRTAASVPLGRVGTTQDMANACLFLLSDKAAFITGTELIVDGGKTAQP
jgi:NAD(P)-dependent dehydrogenase (short-subunit alcohol dehydrogenase family)